MIFSEFSNFFCKVHLIIFTMIPPLSLFNVSRYKRRNTEKQVNKNVQMSALCHSALGKGKSHLFSTFTQNKIWHCFSGCEKDGEVFEEGSPVPTSPGNCENCYCLKGEIQCVEQTCGPHIKSCTPIIKPGECCPSSYDCSKFSFTFSFFKASLEKFFICYFWISFSH